MTPAPLPREALRRIVASLVPAEIHFVRGTTGSGIIEEPAAWADDLAMSVGSVQLDSLELVHAAAALYEMFAPDAVGLDTPPPHCATVGEWLDVIADWQLHDEPGLTVMTSGSTGRPKPCRHAIADLRDEAAFFAGILPAATRVIALVPAHHIYGLIWTALLPAELRIPVIAASVAGLPLLAEGDLIVGVPDQWRALMRMRRSWPARISGVTAGAPLDDGLANDLRAAGLACLHDVYGSSETGGIALREAQDAAYTLLPRWRFDLPIDENAPILLDRRGCAVPLPDRLRVTDDRTFTVLGRRDGAVQVGGMNVWPEQVAAMLQTCPGVADISVRLNAQRRLKAFVVPTGQCDESELLDRLRRHAERLPRPEQRPTAYAFGPALPRSALGKLSDWP